MANDTAFHRELRRELTRLLARTIGLRLASGLLSFVAVGAWVFLAVVLWTALTGAPPLWQTLTVSWLTLALLVLIFAFFVVVPVVKLPGLGRLTRELESRRDFQDIVEAGYEFSRRDDIAQRYSPELVGEVIRQAVRSISGLEARLLFLERRQLALVPFAYAALIVLIVIGFAAPATVFDAGERLVSPRVASAVEREANLFASPGDITVLSGSDVEVSAIDFGGSERPVTLSYNLSEEFWKTEPTESKEVLSEDNTPVARHAYTHVRDLLPLRFANLISHAIIPRIDLDLVNKPIVADLKIVLTPPPYTGEAPDTLVDSGGNLQALEGTHVAIKATSNNDLAAAWVQFGEAEEKPVEVAGRSFDFDFTALEDGTYSIRLEDQLAHKTEEPLVYSVEVYQDNPPVLDVLEPGGDASLPRNMRIDVAFAASDDYGVSRAGIYARKAGDERFTRTNVPLGDDVGGKDIAASFTWSLEKVDLFPGEYLEYFIQVEDNNVVTGPGVTKSRIFNITVPTMAELYEQIQDEDSKREDMFSEAMKESEALKERMEKLSREFKKTEKLDWAQKKEVDKAIQSHDNVREKVEEIQKSLDETLQSLSDNKMTSQEIGEKMEQIQKLIEEINDKALNEYIEQLREAMEKLDPEEIAKALENVNLSAEDLLKNLERTEALLKQIQQEQQMEELVRQTQDLMEQQDDVNDQTAAADPQDSDKMQELSEKQKELAEKMEELAKKMEQLAEKMKNDGNSEMSEQMSKAAQQTRNQQTSGKMNKASKKLDQGDKQQAMNQQQEAMDDLIGLFTRMTQIQAAMQGQNQQRVVQNLQRLAQSTLELSFKQEDLTERVREHVAADTPEGTTGLAGEQQTYARAVQQIAGELDELSKQSLEIPQFLLQGLGETLTSMNTSTMFLEQNKAFMSTTSSQQATTSLNKVTMDLLAACQNCQKGGAGSGQQAMQQLLQGQQQMLEQSQEMLSMQALQEKMLQERLAAMQRLAAQQRSLEELAKEVEKSAKTDRSLGRMDKVVEEMQEVIRDLEGGVLDDQTVRNQQHIVSRLLDAQRSVHTRDYEKKRESMTAQDLYSQSVGKSASKNPEQQLREEIRRAMMLKAPGEFEDLIKLYFRALAEEQP